MMVVEPITRVTSVGNTGSKRFQQAECEQGLGRNLDGPASRDGHAGSCCGACSGPDSRTFTASGDRADNRTEYRARAHVFTRSLVGAETWLLASYNITFRFNAVALSVDIHGIHIQYEVV